MNTKTISWNEPPLLFCQDGSFLRHDAIMNLVEIHNILFNAFCKVIFSTDRLGMWHVWERRGGCIGSCWGNRMEGDHWGDLGEDVWIILGWISSRWDVGIWTGLGWHRIETGGGRL